MSSPLSNKQKKLLVQLARSAFNLVGAKLRGKAEPSPYPPLTAHRSLSGGSLQDDLDALARNGSNACFETWRHEQISLACGKHGLRLCSQDDYKTVEAHFQKLLGRDDQAFKAYLREESNPQRVWLHNIKAACAKWGFELGYAETLCRRIHRVALADAPPDVLRKILFTLNNRGQSRKRHQEAA